MSRISSLFSVRRRLLQSLALATVLPLSGSAVRPGGFKATFLQLWTAHLELPLESWRSHFSASRNLGCDEIILQWVGVDNGETAWRMPDRLLSHLFDVCDELGLGLKVGLPYDERWWKVLQASELSVLASFLEKTGTICADYIARSEWPRRAAFRGWYIPYELEQHSWVRGDRRTLLLQWLLAISSSCARTAPQFVPAISTYLSRLPSSGTLSDLWSEIVNDVHLYPMIQDGVGISGLSNYVGLEPLRKVFRSQAVEFDLIIELFTETPAQPGQSSRFTAQSARYSRVHTQLQIAENYGARRVVAFAIDPWMTGDNPAARRLLRSWRAVYG